MRFSIFTPTHNTRYLPDLFLSLLAQNSDDWNWVIVTNQDAVVPPDIADHPQVSVYQSPNGMSGIGALKRFSCEKCRGEWLIEVDHDDVLSVKALSTISKSIDSNPDVGFIYSDSANFYPDWSFQIYGAEWGWRHRYEWVNGHEVIANVNQPLSLYSMSSIGTSPDHIRCFRAEDYWRVGGHDASLPVCDDYDLMCRLYIDGVKFHHISECLYLYRLLPNNDNSISSSRMRFYG